METKKGVLKSFTGPMTEKPESIESVGPHKVRKSRFLVGFTHYQTAEREWLLEQLPERNWQSIRGHAREPGLSRPYQPLGESLPAWMSVNDKKLIDRLGLPLDQREQRVWWVKSGYMNHETISCHRVGLHDMHTFVRELRSLVRDSQHPQLASPV